MPGRQTLTHRVHQKSTSQTRANPEHTHTPKHCAVSATHWKPDYGPDICWVWRSFACSRHSREYPLDRLTLWEKRGGLELHAAVPFTENAISLSSGFWVGFHKPLALTLLRKSLDATASAAILWRYWSFFSVYGGRVGNLDSEVGVGKPRSWIQLFGEESRKMLFIRAHLARL
ncbi:hypothetical protein E4T50_15865 [Aureobasidium sp. EXF-12298]|nr:hypothetical protein E4T50_15865 [Aureobasidium sp. EXF-12298]KAI4755689.1 hypothetical protein E4T51_11231 [Aureobasidium sp. EXF-12344]KAI4772776.1 hypothetical protein E4T52_12244 [Aureobasidium sp. EXF-3400]